MALFNLAQAINLALGQEMEKDKKVVLLGEDIGVDGGVFRVTEGLLDKFGSDRVMDTPLAESAIIGASIGMAIYGLKPVAEIQFDGFIYPALDQLISHAAKIRNRSRGRFTCPLVVRVPCAGGIHAPEHHSESPETHIVHTPGLKAVIPSNPYDAKGLMAAAIRDPDPVVFFEPKKLYRASKQEVPEKDYEIPIGKASIAKEGGDVTLISWGTMVHVCTEAAEKLKEKNIDVEIIDVRSLSPLDTETILTSVQKTGRAVIVHEAPRTLGLGAEIAATISEADILSLKAPVKRVTGFDIPMPLAKHEYLYLPNAERVAKAAEEVMKF
ncbi:MAG: alpha-ketoacid dehydrogenase subunit beta [Candidatus Aenigmarchaeota archaeon]|nr:alpha-ketoacid dehydrogenase subunit beta [Candidatus Aenigmarchaeota archaeon]